MEIQLLAKKEATDRFFKTETDRFFCIFTNVTKAVQ